MVARGARTTAFLPAGLLRETRLGEKAVDTPVGDLSDRLGQFAVGAQEPAKLGYGPARTLLDQGENLLAEPQVVGQNSLILFSKGSLASPAAAAARTGSPCDALPL